MTFGFPWLQMKGLGWLASLPALRAVPTRGWATLLLAPAGPGFLTPGLGLPVAPPVPSRPSVQRSRAEESFRDRHRTEGQLAAPRDRPWPPRGPLQEVPGVLPGQSLFQLEQMPGDRRCLSHGACVSQRLQVDGPAAWQVWVWVGAVESCCHRVLLGAGAGISRAGAGAHESGTCLCLQLLQGSPRSPSASTPHPDLHWQPPQWSEVSWPPCPHFCLCTC